MTELDPKDSAHVNAWAALASTIVQDELGADAKSTDDEKKIAKALVYLCEVK